MKQFEKWFSVDRSLIPKYGDAGYMGYLERMAAWKAALECVQDMACAGGILQNDFVIREWIREELQDE